MTRFLPNWPTLLVCAAICIARKVGRLRFAHRSGVPSGLSRFASQAKPLLTIAEPYLVLAFLAAVVLVAVLI